MPRVLVLFEYPTLSGGERSLLAVIPTLFDAGWEVLAAAPRGGPLVAALESLGVRVIDLALSRTPRRATWQARARARLAELLKGAAPDLVHANSISMGRLSGPVCRAMGLPSLAHLRDIVRLSGQAVRDLNSHGMLVAVSQAAFGFHVAQGLDAEKTRVLYNGVDLVQFQPRPRSGALRKSLDIPEDVMLIGCVGQIGPRKGTDIVLASAMTWPENFHLAIIGSRYSRKEESRAFERSLREQAASPPFRTRVHFLGQRDDMPELYADLDILVHAAREEPLGRVLLEAGACGLAIVATDVGGTGEIFPPWAQAARLVPANNADAITRELRFVASDAAARHILGANARRRVAEAFGINDAATSLLMHYRQLVQETVA